MAVEKAQLEAQSQIRQFMGEYLVTGKLIDQAETYSEFKDLSQEYSYDENTQIKIESVSQALNLQIRSLYPVQFIKLHIWNYYKNHLLII